MTGIPELQRRMPKGPRDFFKGFRQRWGNQEGVPDTNSPDAYLDFKTRFRKQLGEVQVPGVAFYLIDEGKGDESEELLPVWVSTIPNLNKEPQSKVSTDLPVWATERVRKGLGIDVRGVSVEYDVATREFTVEAVGPLKIQQGVNSGTTYTLLQLEHLRRSGIGVGIKRLRLLPEGNPLPQLSGDQRII